MTLLRGFEENKSGDIIHFYGVSQVANFSVPEIVPKTITKFSKIYPENITSPFRIYGVLFVTHSTSLFLSNVQSFIFWCYLHFNSTTWCHHSSAHCDFQLVRIHVFHDEILILLQSSSSSRNVFGDIFSCVHVNWKCFKFLWPSRGKEERIIITIPTEPRKKNEYKWYFIFWLMILMS